MDNTWQNYGSSALGGSSGGGGFNPYAFMGGGMLGSSLGSLFGGNPSDAGMQYLNQLTGQLPGIYEPWMKNAQSMYGPLSQQLQGLMNNPGGMVNQIGRGYSESPGFQFQKDQAMQAGNQAAAAGGMAGTPMHQQQNEQLATNLANQNYNQWMQNALGMYGQGLSGAEGIYGTGAQMAGQYGSALSNALAQQAQLAAAGQQAQNEGMGGMLGGLLGTGLGFAFGGPMGAAAGGSIGHSVFS